MILLTLICAALSAVAIMIGALWLRFAPEPDAMAHEKALYAGHLADVERRRAAGEIDDDAAHEERTQAARALLQATSQPAGVVTARPIKPVVGVAILAGAAVIGYGVYMVIGHPELPDQPYSERMTRWTRMAQDDPTAVPPQVMAVVLRQGEAEHGAKPDYWLMLGRYYMLGGDNYAGMKAYKRAGALSPQTFDAWSELGEAVTLAAGGKVGNEARQAFAQALQRDPNDARTHYYLGGDAVAQGRFDDARNHFRTALAHTAPDNPSRPVVAEELKAVDTAQAAATVAKERISSMVASLQAQLTADAENADGWARLLRSYEVLGDQAAYEAALARMQAHYAERPQIAAAIVEKSKAAVGTQ